MPPHALYPPGLAPDRVRACVGLISDTHMPMRRATLPPSLFEVFAGVDLIMHAGDVGELWVLDQLGAIAPVVAVHGNDDTVAAQRELPYRQVVSVAGARILLWHSHYPDREEELASRRGDVLPPKFERSILFGRRAGAQVVVFGHWHIPLVYRSEDIQIVNPGALAAGNAFTAMHHDTVALLFIDDEAAAHVVHVDLAHPQTPFEPHFDIDAGFDAVAQHHYRSIVTPEVSATLPVLWQRLSPDDITSLLPVYIDLARPFWEGQPGLLTLDAVIDELHHTRDVAPTLVERALHLIDDWRATTTVTPD